MWWSSAAHLGKNPSVANAKYLLVFFLLLFLFSKLIVHSHPALQLVNFYLLKILKKPFCLLSDVWKNKHLSSLSQGHEFYQSCSKFVLDCVWKYSTTSNFLFYFPFLFFHFILSRDSSIPKVTLADRIVYFINQPTLKKKFLEISIVQEDIHLMAKFLLSSEFPRAFWPLHLKIYRAIKKKCTDSDICPFQWFPGMFENITVDRMEILSLCENAVVPFI